MNPGITLNLRPETMQAILAEAPDRVQRLQTELDMHMPQMNDVINAYMPGRYRVQGKPEFQADFTATLAGTILVRFSASQYNACDSTVWSMDDDRRLSFRVAPGTGILTISGDAVPERSTFEEF